MNPIKEKIFIRLDEIPQDYLQIKEHALKYCGHCCAIEKSDIMKIGHQPWVAPMNYAITIYPPAKKAWFEKFRQNLGRSIPTIYQNLLLKCNGCFLYKFQLFGLPPSMQNDPPILDRTYLQCLDLLTANKSWINAYNIDPMKFHFGGRAYSDNENIGYFIEGKNKIEAIRKNGEIVSQWTSISEFLRDELNVSEEMMLKDVPEDWWC